MKDDDTGKGKPRRGKKPKSQFREEKRAKSQFKEEKRAKSQFKEEKRATNGTFREEAPAKDGTFREDEQGEMMPWHKVQADLTVTNIQEEFGDLYMSCGGPKGMALFCSVDAVAPNVFYFSPRCSDYIKASTQKIGCEPCDKPAKGSVVFLVGEDSDRDALL